MQKEKEVLNDEQNRDTLKRIQLPSIYMNNTQSLLHQKAFEEYQRNVIHNEDEIEKKQLKRKRSPSPPIQSEFIYFSYGEIDDDECEITSFISK